MPLFKYSNVLSWLHIFRIASRVQMRKSLQISLILSFHYSWFFFFFVLFFAFCKKFFLKTDKKLRSKIIFNLESIIG